jgi:hypothetical protein
MTHVDTMGETECGRVAMVTMLERMVRRKDIWVFSPRFSGIGYIVLLVVCFKWSYKHETWQAHSRWVFLQIQSMNHLQIQDGHHIIKMAAIFIAEIRVEHKST